MLSLKTRRSYSPPTAFDRLLPDQLAQVQSWLINERLSYDKTRLRIQQQFGVKISHGAMLNYYHRVVGPLIQHREREREPLSLEITYLFKCGPQVIGEHEIVLALTRASLKTSPPVPLPPEIHQLLQGELN